MSKGPSRTRSGLRTKLGGRPGHRAAGFHKEALSVGRPGRRERWRCRSCVSHLYLIPTPINPPEVPPSHTCGRLSGNSGGGQWWCRLQPGGAAGREALCPPTPRVQAPSAR